MLNYIKCLRSQLEDVEVTVADQVNRVPKSNFEAVWTDMGSSGAAELEETYSLTQVKSLDGLHLLL